MMFPDRLPIARFLMQICFLSALFSCNVQERRDYYSFDDFSGVPKIDAHFHYNTADTRFLEFADSLQMWFVSPNVDAGRSISEQFGTARTIKEKYPDRFFFLGTFGVDNFNDPEFAGGAIRQISEAMASGASGIKVWKNIGMELKNRDGEYVMIDDPAFHPVFEYLQENSIPLLGHLGEPLNCWLPVGEMTLGNDKRYFANNPQYHMYLHPEAPSYADQINARDNVLKRYPQLVFSGAHLASLEWSIEELAHHFESFPNVYVDMSARIGHLQYQSLSDHNKVRDFLIKYQDRIMYGTDISVSVQSTDYRSTTAGLHRRWLDDWVYLATDSTIIVNDLDGTEVKGLRLPASVIDRIYYRNALQLFKR
jgi:predicted TIM-barrel fold metal-dependent hydrolase